MNKGGIKRLGLLRVKLPSVLKIYSELVDSGCTDSCQECFLGKVIIKEGVPYEYAEGKLVGPLSICDLLGVLLKEIDGTLLS